MFTTGDAIITRLIYINQIYRDMCARAHARERERKREREGSKHSELA